MDKQVSKFFKGQIRSFDPETFTFDAVISDETVDRYKERVLVSSFKKTIKDFMKHPIMLSSHKYGGWSGGGLMNQIGTWEKIKVDNDAKEVVGTGKIFVGDGNPEADWAWKLVEKGVAAFSIGFVPKVWKDYDEDERKVSGGSRRDYEEIELLEVSQVLIPANPSALQKTFDGIPEEVRDFMESSQTAFDVGESDNLEWGDNKEESEDEIETRKWEETENEIRHRVRAPEGMDKFRSFLLKKDKPKVRAIYGREKESKEWKIQALRFPKADGWTVADAKKWVKEHPDVLKEFEASIDVDEFEAQFYSIEDETLDFELDDFESIRLELVEVRGMLQILLDSLVPKEKEAPVVPDPEPIGNDSGGEQINLDSIGEDKLQELREIMFGKEDKKSDVDSIKKMFDDVTAELSQRFSVQS